MTVRTFGRKGIEDAGMSRRREAFIASERARREQPPLEAPREEHDAAAPPSRPVFVREKSLTVAYVLWFLCGAISAHRFYLGRPVSAVIQASLWIVCWLMLAAGFLFAFVGLAGAIGWVLADVFLIPGLCRTANERARQNAADFAFA